MRKTKEWFGEWFDSPYYHILYKDRDYTEAEMFLNNLISHLALNPTDKIMDLACGKGRHAIYLNDKGYNVVGLDLSPVNIRLANQHKNECLHFFVHDMRHLFVENEFDYVFNMFTSFGYFDTKEEHQQVISNMAQTLKPNGRLVLDFLNPHKVINQLVPEEVKVKEGVEFHITKTVNHEDYIIKTITFNAQNIDYNFQEKVKAIKKEEFLLYFEKVGLMVEDIFGGYDLSVYDCNHSERMIFIAKK